MKELEEEIKEYLLEFQDDVLAGEPRVYFTDKAIILTYNTSKSYKMYINIINSIALLKRIHSLDLIMSDLVYTQNALIVEFEYNNNRVKYALN